MLYTVLTYTRTNKLDKTEAINNLQNWHKTVKTHNIENIIPVKTSIVSFDGRKVEQINDQHRKKWGIVEQNHTTLTGCIYKTKNIIQTTPDIL